MTLDGVKPNMPDLGNIDAVITSVVEELDRENGTGNGTPEFQHHKQRCSARRRATSTSTTARSIHFSNTHCRSNCWSWFVMAFRWAGARISSFTR